jgi:HK97 family phage major capsid protein
MTFSKNPNVARLQKERERILAEITQLKAEIGNSEPTAADKDTLASLMQLRVEADERIARAELLLDAARRDARPFEPAFTMSGAPRLFTSPVTTPAAVSAGAAWAARTFGPPEQSSGFATMQEFLEVVKSGRWDDRIQAAGQQEGSGASGGFLVPEQHVIGQLAPAYEHSIVLPRCLTVPMAGESLTVAGWDQSSAAGGSLYGGFAPEWIGEDETMDVQSAKVRKIKLTARKCALLGRTSNEILDDAGSLASLMAEGLGVALAWTIDYEAIHGSGAGKPLGLLNSPSKITVTKEVGQAASTIVFENVTKMMARLHPSLYSTSVWMAHPSTLPSLYSMSIPMGTAGSHVPALVSSDQGAQLLLRPVIWSEKCMPVGTAGDLILCSWSEYVVGLRKAVSIEQSSHAFFTSDAVAWRGVLRMDGQPRWEQAYQPPNSAPTLSWAVVLESR